MHSDVLKRKELYSFFSRSAFEKAHAYQAQGRVKGLEVSEDLTHLRARVRGSGSNEYRVDIHLDYSDNRLSDVDGECSCPMSVNCKHVAATLLEATSDGPQPASASTIAKIAPTLSSLPPVLGYAVTEWLDSIGNAVRGDDYPAGLNQRLLYRLHPSGEGVQTPVLAVSLLSVKVLKDGTFGSNPARPSPSEFLPERAPKYYRDADVDILGQLSAWRGTYYAPRPLPAELVQRIVATGRAYWLDHKRQPLRWSDQREGRIEWRASDRRGVAPCLLVPGMIALNAEPPLYVDESVGTIGPVDLGLPPKLARRILSAPEIPRDQVLEVSRRLGQSLPERHHGFLPAAPTAAVRIDEEPVPVLRLQRARVREGSYYYYDQSRADGGSVAVARLGFRYGPVEIDSAERANRPEAFHAGKVYEVLRRRPKEKEARKRLIDLGFVDAVRKFSFLDASHARDLTLDGSHDWLDFLDRDAAELRASGFEILIDGNFPHRLAESGDFDAEFESIGIDWFELALGIDIDGERRDLAPMLAALISRPDFTPDLVKQFAENGRNFYLPLADGRHVSVAADRFLPLVLALHGLNLHGISLDVSGKLKLSRADIVPLLGFESHGFVFKGADNLRRLAALLHTQGLSDPRLPESFRAGLRPYQEQGVAWLDLLRESGLGGVLADDMGLGKTVQILALIALEKARGHLAEPTIVVAPTSLMSNWFSETQKFVPDLKVLVLHGPDRKRSFAAIPEHDVVLTTYPLIARDREVLLSRDWHMAVLDEAQTVKNPDAATTRWLRGIKARHRFCLTGTPMENHLGELWSIMSFANPGYLGDKASFVRRWRTPIEKRADKVRSAALARRVRPFLLRRTKAEVAGELPAKTEIVERIALEGGQRDLYDSIRLSMSEKVRKAIQQRGLARSHIVVLEALLRMRQVCCDPALLKLDDIERPSAKLDRLMEMVLELLSEGRKIIVFSQFTSMLDLVRARLDAERVRYGVLTGETRNRKAAIDGFQTGANDVFLISLKAGGVGLNLTAADTVIIFDPWWNPAVEEQAIDRAHRIGQDKPVFVYRLVASGTVEEKMEELKERKRALADSVFDADGRIGSALTEEDVRALFDD